jgi:hypothetical protein
MTRERITEGLSLLVLQLANNQSSLPNGWDAHEWAYVKGLASGELMRLRDRLVAAT